jgi:subtilisin family serine protease
MTWRSLLALGSLAAAGLARGQAAGGGDGAGVFYTLGKTPIRLNSDGRQVAVLAPNGLGPHAASAREIIPGWFLVRPPAPVAESVQFTTPVFTSEHGLPIVVTPELLVRFGPGVPGEEAERILADAEAGKVLHRDFAGMEGLYHTCSSHASGLRVLEIANALAQRPDVIFAEPDLLVAGTLETDLPNDVQFFRSWGVHSSGQNVFEGLPDSICQNHFFVDCDQAPTGIPDWDIDGPEAWKTTSGDPSVITVVFEGGVQLDHPELMIDPSFGFDATGDGGGGGPIGVCDNHGTLVAGVVGASMGNTIGTAGVAPGSTVGSARVYRPNPPDPKGNCSTTIWFQFEWFLMGLDWADSIGARVTNHSYALGAQSAAYEQKLSDLRDAGVVHFASAGNGANSWLAYPSSLPTVNAVAALRYRVPDIADFSNYGDGLAFCAAGTWVRTTDRTGDDGAVSGWGVPALDDYAFAHGTSFASPHAAGVAALILSVDPDLSAEQVEQIMAVSARDIGETGYDTRFGWGYVNAADAVTRAQCFRLCPWDLECDGMAGTSDLLAILAAWGSDPGGPPDFDNDGTVSTADLLELLANWGSCP